VLRNNAVYDKDGWCGSRFKGNLDQENGAEDKHYNHVAISQEARQRGEPSKRTFPTMVPSGKCTRPVLCLVAVLLLTA